MPGQGLISSSVGTLNTMVIPSVNTARERKSYCKCSWSEITRMIKSAEYPCCQIQLHTAWYPSDALGCLSSPVNPGLLGKKHGPLAMPSTAASSLCSRFSSTSAPARKTLMKDHYLLSPTSALEELCDV